MAVGMAFQTILDAWQAEGRFDDAGHALAALATFGKVSAAHAQVLDNLDNDPRISSAKRRALLEQLLNAVADDEDIVVSNVVNFCRAHQCKGPKQPTAQQAYLGHVEERAKLERTLASASRASAKSGITRRRRSAAPAVDHILRADLESQRNLLKTVYLAKRIMWSLYQSRFLDEPFHRVSTEAGELVRRLGLGVTDPSKELLFWAHRLLPHQTARVPTAFDAADYEFFRPGGKTMPLTGDDGMREVVHPPVTGDQLTHRIERAL